MGPLVARPSGCAGGRASINWVGGAWPAAGSFRQVGVETHDMVGFLEPAAQLVVEVGPGLNHNVVLAPPRPVVDLLDDPGTVQPAVQREGGLEAALARGQ